MRRANGEVAVDAGVAAFLRRGVAVIAATCDRDLRPEITRGWGPELSADGRTLRICLAAEPGSRTLANLESGGELAATCTMPSTYRGIQLKGAVREFGEPSEEDISRVESHIGLFVEEVVAMGVPRSIAPRFADGPYVAVTLEVRELYDQTPGARAGSPL